MARNTDDQNPFSTSSLYSVVICGTSLPHCMLWLRNNNFNLLQQQLHIDTYQLKRQFKDQAHLISFIQELFDNRFTIVSIKKEQKLI